MIRGIAFIFTFVMLIPMVFASEDAAYNKTIEAVRVQRIAQLTKPDGWLSLIGLHWLKEGTNTVGSGSTNDIVLAKGPARLGEIVLTAGKVLLALDPKAADVLVDSKSVLHAELLDDGHPTPSLVSLGSMNFYVIQRGSKWGLRVKDSAAETRQQFLGLDYFAIDPSWRIEAQWEVYDPPREIEISTVIGTVEKYPVSGAIVFKRDGHIYRLTPYAETPEDSKLFLVFADRTSGKETYGAARFLVAERPKAGKVILDFNQAYNPPCAFTPYATCPLAPPENRLDLRVTAGEKKYRGAAH